MDPAHLNKLFSISNWLFLLPCYCQNSISDLWNTLVPTDSTNQDELQCWLVSLMENPRQYKSIFGFTKGHDGGLRASVGKSSLKYSTRSPFFIAAMGSTCKQGTPMGTKNERVPHWHWAEDDPKRKGSPYWRRSTVRDAFLLLKERGKGQPILLIIRKGVR